MTEDCKIHNYKTKDGGDCPSCSENANLFMHGKDYRIGPAPLFKEIKVCVETGEPINAS